jgi:hypothetical protein|tara:strand:+ start:269 stop:568 length:300 start_codon:yes stop_codon:yes gene_type:complete
VGGILYEANVGAGIVQGPSNSESGYSYGLQDSYSNPIPIASQVAMDGGDGSWAVVTNVKSNALIVNVDEDQIGDSERAHTTEQVAYFVVGGAVTIPLQP